MDRCDFRPTQCQYCNEIIIIFKDLKVNLILFNFYFRMYDEKLVGKNILQLSVLQNKQQNQEKWHFILSHLLLFAGYIDLYLCAWTV